MIGTVLVTGATGGIGLATARALAALGAHVIVGARDVVRGAAVADDLVRAGGRANVIAVDLASLRSVREAAARYRSAYASLDVLVNNAGIIATRRETTVDGHEKTWATNLLGLGTFTHALLPALAAAAEPRVVNVGSAAHAMGRIDWDDLEFERRRFRGFAAYAQSKLALVLYTREFARRHPGIAANVVHPGAIATGIWRALPSVARGLLGAILPSPERGAAPVVRLASAPDVRALSGRYFDRLNEAAPSRAARDDAAARRLWTYVEGAIATAPS
ncbi:MAG: SDR family oxidoreductase [Vulcanimicrobiaceae bacterium]